MNIREHAESLLQSIANALPEGLVTQGVLRFDANDECLLTLDGRIPIMMYLEEESSALILNSPLGLLPSGQAREAVMLKLLRANYCWNQTEGGTLGVDEGTGLVCMSYLVALPLAEPGQMPDILTKLAGIAAHWQQVLQEMSEDDAELDEAPAGGTMIRA